MRESWSRRLTQFACALGLGAVFVVSVVPVQAAPARSEAERANERLSAQRAQSVWRSNGWWFQQVVYVYASGNAAINEVVAQAERDAHLTDAQMREVTSLVRTAWLDMMRRDPATLGRQGVSANYAGQLAVVSSLRAALGRVAGNHYRQLLAATTTAYQQASSVSWLSAHGLKPDALQVDARTGQMYVMVYATSFSIPGDSSSYVALPDAYLKFADLGEANLIPTLYRPYYTPARKTQGAPYTVDIGTSQGKVVARGVPIKDVGPWNEDDNWWDPTNATATLPPGCPVASTLVSADSLQNAAVDGICPGARNYRRTAYYLLYQHIALPFFQPVAYAPTGTFADATAWPQSLPQYCPEAAAASRNNDGVACAASFAGYNGNAGDWLRSGSVNAPVLNQAGIDLSPALDHRLGWKWPSSGFIRVNVARLP